MFKLQFSHFEHLSKLENKGILIKKIKNII